MVLCNVARASASLEGAIVLISRWVSLRPGEQFEVGKNIPKVG